MIWIYISLGVFFVGLSSFLFYPSQRMSKFFGGAKSPSDILKYIGTACGAIIVIGTLYETAQTNKLNIEANKVANEANYLSRKAQLDNRFIEANNLLASDNSSENIAGIYALNQIAIDASKDSIQRGYVQIIKNILCTFIRENSEERIIKDNNTGKATVTILRGTGYSKVLVEGGKIEGFITKPEIVFQTIINVLFVDNTYQIYQDYPTNLQKSVLNNLDLSEVHLENANLEGAYFEFVKFSSKTHLEGANLSSAHLEFADFSGAILTIDDKKSVSWTSHLNGVNLRNAFLRGAQLNGLNLSGVNLEGADLTNANLVETNLCGANLSNANLEYTIFSFAHFDEGTKFYSTIHYGKTVEEIKSYFPNYKVINSEKVK